MKNVQKERILVTVKTYPTLSTTYGETVCTAGVREDGSWVRLYPVPFRRLDSKQQYSKYDWLECDVIRNHKDRRPESFKPTDLSQLVPVGHVSTSNKWQERRRIILNEDKVHKRLEPVFQAAKTNAMSLCVFKPAEVLELRREPEEREWDSAKMQRMREIHGQSELFDDNSWRATFEVIEKLPYSFSYRFCDETGRESTLKVLDWEIGQLYWNCLEDANGDDETAYEKVRQKYVDEFRRRDLHFFLGTVLEWHGRSNNPWVIVGVFYPPKDSQVRLL